MFIRFLQQIISDMLLQIVIGGEKNNLVVGLN